MSTPSELLDRIEALKGNRKVCHVRGMSEVLDILRELVMLMAVTPEKVAEVFELMEVKDLASAVATEAINNALVTTTSVTPTVPQTLDPADLGDATAPAKPDPPVVEPEEPAVAPEVIPRGKRRASSVRNSVAEETSNKLQPDYDEYSDCESMAASSVCSIDLREGGGIWELTKNFPPDIKKLRCKKCSKRVEAGEVVDPLCDKCFKARGKELKKRRKYEEKIRKKQDKKMKKLRKLAGTEAEADILERAIAGEVEIVGTADAEALREKIGTAEPDQFHINVYV